MSTIPDFGRLVDVEPRDAWKHEARAFTPWLAENLDRLAAAIGMPDLELSGVEVGVGRYNADILARNSANGQIVLIENQLEISDHNHLGQILTYLAGTEAQVVIWLAPNFREEHLSAIRWLNQHSHDEFSFFAVRLRVVRIAASPLAPLFDVLEKPNAWERRVQKTAKETMQDSESAGWRSAFWSQYEEKFPASTSDRGGGGQGASRWRDVPNSDLVVARWISSDGAGVFIRGDRGVSTSLIREQLSPLAERLETQLSSPLGNDASYPFLKRTPFNINEPSTWDFAIEWLEAETLRYVQVLTSLRREIA